MNLEKIDTTSENIFLQETKEWGIMLIVDFQTESEEMVQRVNNILSAMTNLKESGSLYFSFFLNVQLGLLKKIVSLPDELKGKDEKLFYTAVFDNSNKVSHIKQYDLSKVSGMQKLFDMYIKGKPVKHNCLITWGDGYVNSFFSRKDENKNIFKNELNDYLKQVLETETYDFFYNNFNSTDVSPDNKSFQFLKPFSKYNLSIFELKMAIERSLHKRFDVTFMQNCGMAYYQTLITSSFFTNTLIASANRVKVDSFNFPDLINNIKSSNKKISPDELSNLIITMSDNTFYPFKLSNYFRFKMLINSLGSNFITLLEIENKAELIRSIRVECSDLAATTSFRIIELFQLCQKTLDRASDITTDLKKSCEDLIKFKNQNNWGDVSIFFPLSNDDFEGISLLTIDQLDLNTISSQGFLNKHIWDCFIQKYINKIALQPAMQ
ncbi:MAG: hypothetical protein ABI685_07155 [Ferruginibacter sp.]